MAKRQRRPDPTANVLSLVAADSRRQDDIRELDDRWRQRESALRDSHGRELRHMESARLDAIRQVADANSATAVAAALATTQTLAATTANTFLAVTDRLAQLEKASYASAGGKAALITAVTVIVAAIAAATFVIANLKSQQVVIAPPTHQGN